MKTFKDLRPGDALYYDFNTGFISEIKIDSRYVNFTIRTTNSWKLGSNYDTCSIPLKYYEDSIYIDPYKRIFTTSVDSEIVEKAKNQKKIIEIQKILDEIKHLKQKLDWI